jgi:translation elongation factor EF-G
LDIIPNILLEDESLEFEENKKTNQLLLKGLGELHIDIVLSRIKTDYNLSINLGQMSVSYKEATNGSVTHKETTDKNIKHKLKFFELEIEIEKMEEDEDEDSEEEDDETRGAKQSKVIIDIWQDRPKVAQEYKEYCLLGDNLHSQKSKGSLFDNDLEPTTVNETYTFHNKIIDSLYDIDSLKFYQVKMIEDMLVEMTNRGPLTSSKLVNTQIRVIGGKYNPDYLDDLTIRMTVNNCYLNAIRKLNVSLLEPICKINVKASPEIVSIVMSDAVSKREGKILLVGNDSDFIE